MKTRIAAIAVLAATPALGQEVYSLDPIIVSGGLTPIAAARYGRAVSVVTADEIATRGLTTVQDALRALPGVSVNGSGASYTQVRIRGAESNHTLVLIDGVEAAGGDGDYTFAGLETANIERIEVLRGPQSVYYGSNASAGVINIVTRKGGDGLHYGGTVEYGAGWNASGFVSFRDARGGVSLGLSRHDDEGWDYSGSDGEKDGIDRRTLQLSADYEVAEGLTLGATYRRAEESYDSDSVDSGASGPEDYVVDDPTQGSTREEETMQVWAEYLAPGGRLSTRLSWEHTDDSKAYSGDAPIGTQSAALKARVTYGIDGAIDGANHVVTLMAERDRDSSTENAAYSRKTVSVAAEYRATLMDRLDLQFGVRHDDNSAFENATTWTAAASYNFDNGMRLHASAGTGVVNPTYFELFADVTYGTPPYTYTYTGNPGLTPERNRSFDIGLEMPFAQGRGLLDVTYFNETITDEINYVETAPGEYTYENQAGDSDRQGIEVAGSYDATDALTFRARYTYLHATKPDGTVATKRPRHELGLGATLTGLAGRGSLDVDARYVAGLYDAQYFVYPSVAAELPAYLTVDVAARYRVNDSLTLTGRVSNLFDADHSDSWGYAGRGRTAYVGLSSEW